LETEKNILEDLSRSVLSQFKKNITPLETLNLIIRHFSKLKIAHFIENNPSYFSYAKFHSKYFGPFRVNTQNRYSIP